LFSGKGEEKEQRAIQAKTISLTTRLDIAQFEKPCAWPQGFLLTKKERSDPSHSRPQPFPLFKELAA
jgi:hypothetical protein